MVATKYTDLQIVDFTGGITDKYVDGNANEHKTIDNFMLNEIGKPEIRTGYSIAYDQETLQRIMGIFLLDEDILVFRTDQMFLYDNVSAISQVALANVGQAFFRVTASDIYPKASEWRNQLLVTNSGQVSPTTDLNYPMIVFKDDFGNMAGLEAGLPAYTDVAGMTFTPASIPASTYTYLYRIHYSYEYKVNDVTFRSVGETKQFSYASPNTPDSVSVVVSFFDEVLQAGNQMDVAGMKIELYRTKDAGTTFYKVGEEINGFAGNITDSNSDEALNAFETIYTTGGVVDFSKPPKCRYSFIVNDTAYYCSVIEELAAGDEYRPFRFTQSIPGNITGVYNSAFTDVDDDITGGGSVGGLPIIFTKSYIYRIEGSVNSQGNGVARARVISQNVGCVSNNSIITVGKFLYFFGNDGIYATDGYNVQPLTLRLLDRYGVYTANAARSQKITAMYDSKEERIYWAVSDNDDENNQWLVLHLKVGGMTTCSGLTFHPTTMIERDGEIYRGDELGYIYRHEKGLLNDQIRDVTAAASTWEITHIPFEFESGTNNFGLTAYRKWISTATITMRTVTKLAYKPTSNNDDGEKVADMSEVRLMDTGEWDDVNFIWDDPSIVWSSGRTKSNQRHFPRSHARSYRKQVGIKPAKVTLYKSDIYDVAIVALVAPTNPFSIKITLPIGVKWPTNIVNDTISMGDDGYNKSFTIDSRTDQEIICSGGGAVVGADKKWQIHGFNRKQGGEIKAISIKYTPLSREGNNLQSGEAGGNE